MNNRREYWYGILLLGSLWGGTEALINSQMDGLSSFIPRSVVLAFVAVLLLSAGRRLTPAMGTTLAAGVVAAGMKLVSMPSILACQFAAVIGQALILELLFGAYERFRCTERPLVLAAGIVGASYLNNLSFAFSQAYVFQNHWWLDRGVSGLLKWSFVTGSGAAVASVLGFAVGWYVGRRLVLLPAQPSIRAAYVHGASVVVSLAIWFAVIV